MHDTGSLGTTNAFPLTYGVNIIERVQSKSLDESVANYLYSSQTLCETYIGHNSGCWITFIRINCVLCLLLYGYSKIKLTNYA